ncbi:PIN domain-containing protein [Candidatus Micrarchaeota archaeon]|nr:PIN domain-containing protein [Candidatus Micrarchaeota archaeon]
MSGESSVVYDTSALIEFFQGTKSGAEVRKLFENDDLENNVPSVVICELVSKLKRARIEPSEFVSVIEKNAIMLELDLAIAKQAGALHAELKAKEPGISMVDCIIMAHAETVGGMIVSKDLHFRHYGNTKILE